MTKNVTKKEKEGAEIQATEAKFNLVEFLQESRTELDKVVWPTRKQLVSESIAVILMVTVSATLIYVVDNFFGWAATKVF